MSILSVCWVVGGWVGGWGEWELYKIWQQPVSTRDDCSDWLRKQDRMEITGRMWPDVRTPRGSTLWDLSGKYPACIGLPGR